MNSFERILVPLDGSSLAEKALPPAMALARAFGSQLILLRVLDIPTPTGPTSHPEVTMGWVREARQEALEQAQSYLQHKQQKICDEGIDTQIVLRDRSSATDILDLASTEDVDLIVISSHGAGGEAPWAFGSVAEKVTRHSRCPVLLVRDDRAPDNAA